MPCDGVVRLSPWPRVGAACSAPKRETMDPPEGLELESHRDLTGRGRRPIARWILLGLLCLFLLLGLANVFGQYPTESTARAAGAQLDVSAPSALRGGLFFQARYRVVASEEIEQATLVFDPGWLEDITLNTVEPGPIGEASRDGKIALELGRIPAGREHRLFLHFQVNPTAIGRRSQDLALFDGERLLTSIERDAFIWP